MKFVVSEEYKTLFGMGSTTKVLFGKPGEILEPFDGIDLGGDDSQMRLIAFKAKSISVINQVFNKIVSERKALLNLYRNKFDALEEEIDETEVLERKAGTLRIGNALAEDFNLDLDLQLEEHFDIVVQLANDLVGAALDTGLIERGTQRGIFEQVRNKAINALERDEDLLVVMSDIRRLFDRLR